jgi:hypothetical protein
MHGAPPPMLHCVVMMPHRDGMQLVNRDAGGTQEAICNLRAQDQLISMQQQQGDREWAHPNPFYS